MVDSNRYREAFDAAIGETFGRAIRIIAAEPTLTIPVATILRCQHRAAGSTTGSSRSVPG